MSKLKLTCPECAAQLALGSPVPAGKKIRCPKCDEIFSVPDVPARSARAMPEGTLDSHADDGEATARRHGPPPARRRRRKPTKKGVSPAVAVAAIAGSVLLLGGAGAAVVMYSKTSKGPLSREAVLAGTGLGIGQFAPEIAGEDIDGTPLKLSDYKGKVVVLEFWGHWCPNCRDLYPYERSLVTRLSGKPFAFVGVNSDEDRAALKNVLVQEQITWRSFWNGGSTDGPISQAWKVESWPTIYVIDSKGVIRFKNIIGDDLDRAVDRLLREMESAK